MEFGGKPDHVHLLMGIYPALNITVLFNNLKTASARRTRNRFAEHLSTFYHKPLFWHRADFVSSVVQRLRRYGLKRIPEAEGTVWLDWHLSESVALLLDVPWIMDTDTTVKPLYGKQVGAVVS